MKKPFVFSLLLVLTAGPVLAQAQYEILPDPSEGKVLKGIISRELLEKDTAFKWYANNLKGYTPNTSALAGLQQNKDSLQLIAFMGTWCEDSHYIIPKLFMLLDAAGFSRDKVSLIAVDRNKQTLGHLSDALNVKNVPTIIIMKNGRELGRVVEYGKTGVFDKDLGEILSAVKK